jgi:hypothetical protein
MAHVPGQLPTSILLLGVSVSGCGRDILFEPVQLRYEFFYVLLEIFKFLRTRVSVARDGRRLGQYLIVFDERVHHSESRLEGRKPIRLFRNVEEYLRAVRHSRLLCWKSSRHQGADLTEDRENTHISFDRGYSQRSRNPLDVAFGIVTLVWLGKGEGSLKKDGQPFSVGPSSTSTTMRPDTPHVTMAGIDADSHFGSRSEQGWLSKL